MRGFGGVPSRAWPIVALLTLVPTEAWALSKQARDFLLSVSIDPASENATLADADGAVKTEYSGDPEENSLESLALAKRKNGVRTFIHTRIFIRRLRADFATPEPQPGDELYGIDQRYMTLDERALYIRKISGGN